MNFDQGNNISEILMTMVKIKTDDWMPTLKSSDKLDDEQLRERENRQFELQYKAELDEAMKRRRTYNDNLYKAYALLWKNVQSPCRIKSKQERTIKH